MRRGLGEIRAGNIFPVGARGERSEQGGERRLEIHVPANVRTVDDVRRALGQLGLPTPLLEDARLLVSELVTNSIRHAGLDRDDRIRVLAEWSGTRLRVEVIDRNGVAEPPRRTELIRPDPGAESGWGLYLVDRLAVRWGRGSGRYWFELQQRLSPRRP
jgi:anti-sigma regulatory factor (Ser/Thr protein kinase)